MIRGASRGFFLYKGDRLWWFFEGKVLSLPFLDINPTSNNYDIMMKRFLLAVMALLMLLPVLAAEGG
ncbi:MAG: hypothetical protein IJ879_11315 [Muribaculaceae bacterium]|nr:hypothetical protein [Muribaculaceae bacterium]